MFWSFLKLLILVVAVSPLDQIFRIARPGYRPWCIPMTKKWLSRISKRCAGGETKAMNGAGGGAAAVILAMPSGACTFVFCRNFISARVVCRFVDRSICLGRDNPAAAIGEISDPALRQYMADVRNELRRAVPATVIQPYDMAGEAPTGCALLLDSSVALFFVPAQSGGTSGVLIMAQSLIRILVDSILVGQVIALHHEYLRETNVILTAVLLAGWRSIWSGGRGVDGREADTDGGAATDYAFRRNCPAVNCDDAVHEI